MVLQIAINGCTDLFWECKAPLQVCRIEGTVEEIEKAAKLPHQAVYMEDGKAKTAIYHALLPRKDGGGMDSVLFDCGAYVLEDGRTTRHYRPIIE